jgi:hypothetical protein
MAAATANNELGKRYLKFALRGLNNKTLCFEIILYKPIKKRHMIDSIL